MSEIKEVNPKRPAVEVDKQEFINSLDKDDKNNVLLAINSFKEMCIKENKDHSILFAVGGSVVKETMGTKRPDIDLMIVSDENANFDKFTKVYADYLLKNIQGSSIDQVIEPYYDPEFGPPVLMHTGSIKLNMQNSKTKFEVFSQINRGCKEQIDFDKGSITQGGKKPRDFSILYEYQK